MERPRRPARPGRKPRVAPPLKRDARARVEARESRHDRSRDPDPSLWIPPEYDHVVEYEENLASDFDVVAGEHPRSAVLGAFLLGVAVGAAVASLIYRPK
jgi:hypothetical protein